MPTGSQPAGAYVDACERCMPITPRGHQWHTGWHRRTAA